MPQFSNGFPGYDEEDLVDPLDPGAPMALPARSLAAPKRPISPQDMVAGMSTQNSLDPGVPMARPLTKSLAQDLDRAQRQSQRQTQLQARQSEQAAKKQQSTAVKQMHQQGIDTEVNWEGNTVPKLNEAGQPVYRPEWTSGPKYDPAKKAWMRDFRDETGAVTTKDLWDQGDIHRDSGTGDLFLNMPGGARQVVGRDEDFLRRNALSKEIHHIKGQMEASDISLDRQALDLKPLADEYKSKKQAFDDTSTAASNLNKIGIGTPGWLDNPENEKQVRDANNAFDAAKKEFLPLRDKFDALEKRKLEIADQKLNQRERLLSLHTERDTIDEAQRRPEFAAPSAPDAAEPPEFVAYRQKYGIGGDSYWLSNRETHEKLAMERKLANLDGQIKFLRGSELSAIADASKLGQIDSLNQEKKAAINEFAGRKAVVDKWKAENESLDQQVNAVEARIKARVVTPATATPQMEAAIVKDGALRAKLRETQSEAKKGAWKALQGGFDDIPPSMLKNGDLDPYVVQARTLGRSAAFHTDQRNELIDVLDELKGKGIKSVGGVPIDQAVKNASKQTGVYVEDLLTREESMAIHKGLRGPLVSHNSELFRDPGSLDIAKPGETSIADQNQQFVTNLLTAPKSNGMVEQGNIDLHKRPTVKNPDGSISTVRSISIEEDGKSILIPTVVGNKVVSDQVAVDNYHKTGEHLGIFKDEAAATAYAENLHNDQAAEYGRPSGPQYQADILKGRDEIRNRDIKSARPSDYASFAPEQKKQWVADFLRKKDEDLKAFDAKQVAMGGDRADFVKPLLGEAPETTGKAFANEIGSRLRAAVWSPSAGVWDVGAGLLDSMSLLEAKGRGIKPEETGLHQFAEAARQGTLDLMGEKADSLLAQVGKGVGSSAAFAPAFMAGGGTAVALLGAAQAFGPGYYEAKQKAAAQGKTISEGQAYLRGLVAAGLGTTEGVPISHALDRLDKFTGGSVKRLMNIIYEGGEEYLQEFGQEALQGLSDQIQGLDDREWKAIIGDSAKNSVSAGLAGLLMGVSMNAIHSGTRPQVEQSNAFSALDRTYSSLKEAVRSPESLGAFNNDLQQAHPGTTPLTIETATELLKKTESARNDSALDVISRNLGVVRQTISAISPEADQAKFFSSLRTRPGVVAQTIALGRELGRFVTTQEVPQEPEGKLIHNLVTGRVVLDKLENVAKGGSIDAQLGSELEAQGLLVQKPTESGGTRWVATMPAVAMFHGELRRSIASQPQNFSVAPEAETAKTGALTSEFKQSGDQIISQNLSQPTGQTAPVGNTATGASSSNVQGKAPAAPSNLDQGRQEVSQRAHNPPSEGSNPSPGTNLQQGATESLATTQQGVAPPATFSVKLQSVPDAKGISVQRSLSVQAASAEEAEQIATQQAKKNGWKGDWHPISIVEAKGAPYSQGNEQPVIPATQGEGGGAVPGPAAETARTGDVGAQATNQPAGQTGPVEGGPTGGADTGAVSEPALGQEPSSAGLAAVFADRTVEPKVLNAALKKLGVHVRTSTKAKTAANIQSNGTIVVNLNAKDAQGDAVYEAAAVNEELWHAAGFMAQRARWEAAGKPGNFVEWSNHDAQAIFNDLIDRVESLDGQERADVEQALVDSFNLYFGDFYKGQKAVQTLDQVKDALAQGMRFSERDTLPAQTFAFVHEFARQMAQLREVNSISETTLHTVVGKILDWLNGALNHLRSMAFSIDSEGGVLDGTQIQQLVLDMEAEMARLNKLVGDTAAEADQSALDRYHADPVISSLIDMGGILSRTAAQKKWGKAKFEANRQLWDDAPKLASPGHNSIYNPNSSIAPDEAASYLAEQGHLPAGASAPELWNVVGKISQASLHARAKVESLGRLEFPPSTPVEEFANASVVGPGVLHVRAYHGTPHKVDKFSTEKIGTGEGAQVYGYGLYFAQNRAVSENYRENLASLYSKDAVAADGARLPGWITARIDSATQRGARESEIADLRRDFTQRLAKEEQDAKGDHQPWMAADRANNVREVLAQLDAVEATDKKFIRGNTYTVELDVNDDELLDWDLPLSQQGDKVKAALLDNPLVKKGYTTDDAAAGQSGSVALAALNLDYGPHGASTYLRQLGLKGIRYLDQGSRKQQLSILSPSQSLSRKWLVGEEPFNFNGPHKAFDTEAEARAYLASEKVKQTYNYVIFDDSKIKILEENGTPAGTLYARRKPDTATGDLFDQPIYKASATGELAEVSPSSGLQPVAVRAIDRATMEFTTIHAEPTTELLRTLKVHEGIYEALIKCL